MRIVRRCLLPLITVLIVAGAILLPPYLSRMGDQKLLNTVHREAMSEDRLPLKEATLQERIELLFHWQNGEQVDAVSQAFTENELQTKIQPLAYQSVDTLYQAVPTLASVVGTIWVPDGVTGNRLLLRDSRNGLTANLLQLQAVGQAVLVIDEQTGLVLSLTLSGDNLGSLDVYDTTSCVLGYLDYLGMNSETMSGRETEILFRLAKSDVYYLLRSIPGEFSLCPVHFQNGLAS